MFVLRSIREKSTIVPTGPFWCLSSFHSEPVWTDLIGLPPGSSLWEGLGAYCPSNWTLELLVFLDSTITRRCAVSVKPRLKAPSRGVKRCSLAVRSAVFLDQTLLGNAVLWNRSRLTCLEGPPLLLPLPAPSPSHSETRLSLFKPSLNDTNQRSRHV